MGGGEDGEVDGLPVLDDAAVLEGVAVVCELPNSSSSSSSSTSSSISSSCFLSC